MLKDTGEKYAVKVIKKANLKRVRQLKKISIERHIMERVNHPFVMKLQWYFEDKDKACFVMDYLKSGDMLTLMRRVGKFDERTTAFYIAEIVLAVEYLHSQNIVYRDLKPQNMLLDDEGHIRLIDFGLSKYNFNPMMKNSA